MMLLADIKQKPKHIPYRSQIETKDILKVGDKVRIYFPKLYDATGMLMEYDNYVEGEIIEKKFMMINHYLTIRKEKQVLKDIVITDNFTFGNVIKFVSSTSEILELIDPQLSLL